MQRHGHGIRKQAAGGTNLHAPNIFAISLLLQINQRVDPRPRRTSRIDFFHFLLKCVFVSPDCVLEKLGGNGHWRVHAVTNQDMKPDRMRAG
jgi:hypothetical protein